jgi:ribonuclease P protein component
VAVRCCAHGVQAVASGSRSSPFGADRRLAGRSAFEPLLRVGQRRSLCGYTFYLARRSEGPPRLGILVTRRHAALATERNRIKRCIREAFRLEQDRIGPLDVLVRPPYGVRGSPAMLAQLRDLFTKLDR